jgi:hypothetical protein
VQLSREKSHGLTASLGRGDRADVGGRPVNSLHYAVVVGIERYPGIRDLDGPRADAERFKMWLLSPEGGALPGVNVRSVIIDDKQTRKITDSQNAHPKYEDIDDALRLVNKLARVQVSRSPASFDGTRLYIYLAGHGMAPLGGMAALLMANADSNEQTFANIELGKYLQWYMECLPFREIAVFMDCCRERVQVEAQAPTWGRCSGDANGRTLRTAVTLATTFGGTAVEVAETDVDARQGLFTKALLDGLGGGARGVEGEINSNTIAKYVSDWLKAHTGPNEPPQIPTIQSNPADPIVFRPPGAPLPLPKRVVKIRFPAGYAGMVELKRVDYSTTGDQWSAEPGDWSIELEEGTYAVWPVGASDGSMFLENGLFQVIAKDRDVQL